MCIPHGCRSTAKHLLVNLNPLWLAVPAVRKAAACETEKSEELVSVTVADCDNHLRVMGSALLLPNLMDFPLWANFYPEVCRENDFERHCPASDNLT